MLAVIIPSIATIISTAIAGWFALQQTKDKKNKERKERIDRERDKRDELTTNVIIALADAEDCRYQNDMGNGSICDMQKANEALKKAKQELFDFNMKLGRERLNEN